MPRKPVPCRDCGKLCNRGPRSSPEPTCMDCIRRRPSYRGPKKLPCAGGCGKTCERGSGNAKAQEMMCLECRQRRPGYHPRWMPGAWRSEVRTCVACLSAFRPKKSVSLTCSPECARERKRTLRRNQARYRRDLVVLSAGLPGFLTADLELAMRRKAERCPMPGCGVTLTDAPFLPHSKELDHIVPRCLGGAHTIGNTRIICRLCNARRPDDGSDVVQLDLFSVLDPSAVAPALAPPVREPRPPRIRRTCEACGAPAIISGPRPRCAPCHADLGGRAAAMRADGVKWQDISDRLGLSGPGAACNLVKRHDSSGGECPQGAARPAAAAA